MTSLLPDIVRLTQDLIRIPSMHSAPGEIERCADFIMDWCRENDIAAQKIMRQGVPSVLLLPGGNTARLLLMSHFDVVDALPDQFQPRLEGDLLYGRGAIDDKYAVALSLVLFREKLRDHVRRGLTQDDMSLAVLLTGDEEIGGSNGAGHALGLCRAEYGLALDGGDPKKIIVREKGVLDIMLTATGKAAHGARPWQGVNAIDALLLDYERIRQLFPDTAPDHWCRTVNFGKIRAGHSVNQVPQTAQGWFNIRFTEHDDPQALVREISQAVQSAVDVLSIVPVFAPLPSPLTEILLAHAPGATLTREHGASDARYFMDHGIPGAIWGAEGFGTQHGPQECVSMASMEHLTLCLWNFLTELEKTPDAAHPRR